MIRAIAVLCCLVLTNCAVKDPGTTEVRWGNTGSIYGLGTTSVLSDDSVVIAYTATDGELRTVIRQGPLGTFAMMDIRAHRVLAGVPEHEGLSCPDYGTAFIERIGADGILERAETGCPTQEMDAGLTHMSDNLAAILDGATQ